jgi:anti-sigma regulatory factor (Ser/Thr protein kinase)
MTDGDAAKVRLASEEIFAYLCRAGKSGQEFRVEATSSIYEMEVKFVFAPYAFDPYAFNLSARIADDEQGIENLGLLIASRSVDRFSMGYSQGGAITLVLVKEKTYAGPDACREQTRPLKSFALKVPDAEILKRFASAACSRYEDISFPAAFRFPSKLADMAASGDYRFLVATGTGVEGAEIAGGLIWRASGRNMVEFYGPYIFDEPLGADIAQSLIEEFLGTVAKTDAIGVISRHATAHLPEGYFEALGSMDYRLGKDRSESRPFYYRQLREDAGSYVWADAALTPFLNGTYARLVLPRHVLAIGDDEQYVDRHSVFSVRFDRPLNSVTIQPVLDGQDRGRNIAEHVALLEREGIGNIFFGIDIGIAWQARLSSALCDNGFVPALLLPYGGEQGDVVIFQRTGQPGND